MPHRSGGREINKIIVHNSDSEWGNAAIIDGWHRERGWSGIGYHFVILNGFQQNRGFYAGSEDGVVEDGRPLHKAGAHVKGENDDSIGICLIGKHHFSPEQLLQSLPNLLRRLLREYNLRAEDALFGHRDFTSHKTCPNFEVRHLLPLLEELS